ncbi:MULTISPECIES: DUF4834 family protein [Dysgonomonas]|jgi:hypothetical protein|uniref:DUF4834 family protein n=1 Tax=Dysgonomonas TaxID=156973 RepID=UPI001884510A|nr:DUF4834 family protein [Dysgonomonas sp. GY75]MBF0648815.1 DUF4834 family protein [Dysgonomonas sp. GY75]
MTFLLFLIFAIIIFGVMVLLSVVRGVSSFIFGKPSTSHSGYTSNNRYTSNNNASSSGRSEHASSGSNKKIFSKDEGEYVKYEEIKD